MRTHRGQRLGKTGLLVEIADHQRLLLLPNPARRDGVHGIGHASTPAAPATRSPAYGAGAVLSQIFI